MSVGRWIIHRQSLAACLGAALAILCIVGCTVGPRPTRPDPVAPQLPRSGVARATLKPLPVTGYPTVDVTLGNVPGRFILDTGGRDSLISAEDFVDAARQTTLLRYTVRVSGHNYPSQDLINLRIGDGLLLPRARTIVTDLDNLRELESQRIDGWVTWAALHDLLVDIDLPAGVAEFRSADDVNAAATGHRPLARPDGFDSDPRPFVKLSVNGRDIPALVDTGSYDALVIPKHLYEPANAQLLQARESFGTSGFGSKVKTSLRGALASVRIGDIELTRVATHVTPHEGTPYAVVGIAVLRHFRIVYDSTTRQLWLRGPSTVDGAQPNETVVRFLETLGQRLRAADE